MPSQLIDVIDLLADADIDFKIVNGDVTTSIDGIRVLNRAGSTEATFATKGRLNDVASDAGVVVTDAPLSSIEQLDFFAATTWILTEEPRRLIATMAVPFEPSPIRGVHPSASIDETATIGAGAAIGANAVIGPGVTIGQDTVVHAGVVIQNASLGSDVTIGPGTVIGYSGFGYERSGDEWLRLPHLGRVIIGDHVEIGANTCIDRGTFGDTIVRAGVKIDNLVHIAHNCEIGENSLVIALSMIGGSTIIGESAWIAPASAVRDGLAIGDRSTVGLGAVVVRDVSAGQVVAGVPAREM